MRFLAAALLLTGTFIQDEGPRIVPGDPAGQMWPVSGPAEVENGSELFLRARRVIRRWDTYRKLFTESLSDNFILRAGVVVKGKRFEGSLKGGTAGRYTATLATDEEVLYSDKLALGSIEPLFTRSVEDVKTMLEASSKALEFLDEIERILARQIDNGEQRKEDFLKRVTAWANRIDEIINQCDLTGSATLLREVYHHIRNVQVWDEKALPPPAMNDPPRNKKKVFVDMDLTIAALQKLLETLPQVLSSEIKVSTTFILERQIAQAGENEKKREAARGAARAASKLAEAAPVADKDLVRILDKASDRSTEPAEMREELRRAGNSLVVQQ